MAASNGTRLDSPQAEQRGRTSSPHSLLFARGRPRPPPADATAVLAAVKVVRPAGRSTLTAAAGPPESGSDGRAEKLRRPTGRRAAQGGVVDIFIRGADHGADLDVVEPVAESRVVLQVRSSCSAIMGRGQVLPSVLRDQPMLLSGRHARVASAGSPGVVRAGDRRSTRHLCVGADAASRWSGRRGLRPADAVGPAWSMATAKGCGRRGRSSDMCLTDVAFRVLCAQDGPDHATIARFRADAQEAFTDLFAQVLLIAARTGLARFGTVAIDGTKIRGQRLDRRQPRTGMVRPAGRGHRR